MAKRRSKRLIRFVVGALVAALFMGWLYDGTRPMPRGKAHYIRFEKAIPLEEALAQLHDQQIVRDPLAYRVLAWLIRKPPMVAVGTYSVRPGIGAVQLLRNLSSPMRRKLRLPETNWAQRTARLLEKYEVTKASDYMDWVRRPAEFKSDVSFPLPKDSLEGYLYPDTYDLPPLIGARAVIFRQLKNFEKRIWEPFHPADLDQVLTIGSMVQMESGKREDDAKIAAVITNRLHKKMPLQIDATICYALQKWKRLRYSDYTSVKSPYNTYLHAGLPPGPICSPTAAAVKAALNPDHGLEIFYVARPDGSSVFSDNYKEHLKRVKERNAEKGFQTGVNANP